MEKKRQILFLGALLHDIGKFYQRADKKFFDKYNQLSPYSKRIADDICPINEYGRFGYQHVVWANEFLEKVKIKINDIPELEINVFENSDLDNLSNFICNHHKPQTPLQAIVSLADWWSAGVDRRVATEKEEVENESNIAWGRDRYKKIPLFSIFNLINNGEANMSFGLEPLSIGEKCFPRNVNSIDDGLSEEKYKELWNLFIKEFEQLPTDSLDAFIETLIFLLKKYTWCIPSNTMDMANVSLFDHLKTTAAFADCLFQYYNDKPDAFSWNNTMISIKENEYPVLLLGGDISGIQKFIYNISSKKAALSLKGRSFYLQLLIDSIIQKIQSHENIKASLAHIVYSSGGKFYMLLPNTAKIKEAINEISEEVEHEMWNKFSSKLIVNFAYIPFVFNSKSKLIDIDIKNGNNKSLGDLWKVLSDKLQVKKKQKNISLLFREYNTFFTPQSVNNDGYVCAVTGEDLNKHNYYKYDNLILSKPASKMIDLGKVLKDVDYIIAFKGNDEKSTYLSNRLKYKESIIGVANYLFDKIELTDDEADFRKITSADVSCVKTINNTNFLHVSKLKGKNVSYGFQFYGGNEQAKNLKGNNRTFEELTELVTSDSNSETYLGVLRMDIDNLGEMFIKGIPSENKSFSAYSNLSSHLDWFFSGYINNIRARYSDNINIIYSGGDDVFAVGRWDCLIDFARDIRSEFRRFVGRDDISISAGLSIINNKFPIAKAAELSEMAEKSSKNFKGKNAISFLGKTISWREEFDEVETLKNEFVNLITNHGMSKGILHRMMIYEKVQAKNIKNKDIEGYIPDLSIYWNAAYYLKRFKEKKDNEVIRFCSKLEKDIHNERKLELIAIAARWAELQFKNN